MFYFLGTMMASLSWSNTRITVLEYCQKKYFFTYYSDGLKKNYPELWKTTKILKRLKSLDMRMWEMTHKILSMYLFELKKYILNDWPTPDKESIVALITKNMEETFAISKSNDYTNFVEFWLSEHFYQEIDDDALTPVIQKVINNLEAFIASDYHQKIEQRFRKWHHIYIEDPRRPNFEMMKVDVSNIAGLENISILASPDFWIMFWENNYLILDWKSWKESLDISGITDQLRIYGLKTLLKQKSTELWDRKIDVHEIYLPSLHEKSGSITQEDVEHIIWKILEDIEYQKQFIVEQDTEINEPLNHTAFTRTSNEKKCIWCTFRSVCKQLKQVESAE